MAAKSDWSAIEFRKWSRQYYADDVYEGALRREDHMRRAGTLPSFGVVVRRVPLGDIRGGATPSKKNGPEGRNRGADSGQ